MWKAGLLLGLTAGCDIVFGVQPIPFGTDANDPLGDALVAHYPFDAITDNTASDVFGHHDATCAVGQCPTPTPGVVGGALAFDASMHAEYISVQPSPSLALVPAFTVAAFVEIEQLPPGPAYTCPINQTFNGGDGTGDAWQLCITPEGWPTFFSITPDFRLEIAQHAVPLASGHWTHIALENDGTTMTLWLDGVQVEATPASPPMADRFGITLFGADLDAGSVSGAFTGALDDVRLYTRTLDRDELAQLATGRH